MARERSFARTYAKALNAYPHVMAAEAAIHDMHTRPATESVRGIHDVKCIL